MKWILSLLLLISIGAIGQTEDSTKYIWYKFQYGSRMPRFWSDSAQHIPYGDTALFAKPQAPGFIMMHTDKNVYRWDGIRWMAMAGTIIARTARGDSLVVGTSKVRDLDNPDNDPWYLRQNVRWFSPLLWKASQSGFTKQYVDIMIFGDSKTEFDKLLPHHSKEVIGAKFKFSGPGYVQPGGNVMWNFSGPSPSVSNNWTLKTRSTGGLGLGAYSIVSTVSSTAFTFRPLADSTTYYRYDSVDVFYYGRAGGGTFEISGGTAPVSVNTSLTTGVQKVSVGGFGDANTTVTITPTAQGTTGSEILAFNMRRIESGVRVHRIGQSGAQISDYLAMDSTEWEQQVRYLDGDVAVIWLGTNERVGNVTPDSVKKNMKRFINRIKVARGWRVDIILMGITDRNIGTWPGGSIDCALYNDVYRQIALEDTVAFFDTYKLTNPDFNAWQSGTEWTNDNLHEDTAAGKVIAAHMWNAFPEIGGQQTLVYPPYQTNDVYVEKEHRTVIGRAGFNHGFTGFDKYTWQRGANTKGVEFNDASSDGFLFNGFTRGANDYFRIGGFRYFDFGTKSTPELRFDKALGFLDIICDDNASGSGFLIRNTFNGNTTGTLRANTGSGALAFFSLADAANPSNGVTIALERNTSPLMGGAQNDMLIRNGTNGKNILFGTNSGSGAVERMRIASTGNVSIGTLDTDLTAPTTSGTTKMVISDANGLLSNTDIPNGIWNASKTATGDFTQNWNTKDLIFDSVKFGRFLSTGLVSSIRRDVRLQYQATNTTYPMYLSVDWKAVNEDDSVSNRFTVQHSGNATVMSADTWGNNDGSEVRVTADKVDILSDDNTASSAGIASTLRVAKNYIQIHAYDSLLISGAAGAATADSLLGIVFSQGSAVGNPRIDKVVKVPFPYKEATVASSATPSPTGDARNNYLDVSALATGATFAAPTGTAANHNELMITVRDNGTPQTLTFNAAFNDGSIALPATTVANEILVMKFIYSTINSKWNLTTLTTGL